MDAIILFIKGAIIGAAGIAPGLSGGALAIAMRVYDHLMDAVLHFLKKPKKYLPFVIPLGLGGLLGMVAFSRVLVFLFENHNILTRFAFVGLIGGTIPGIGRTASQKGFKPVYLGVTALTCGLITFLGTLSSSKPIDINVMTLLLSGLILGVGTVVPGLSSSVLLMALGTYDDVMRAISVLNIPVLIPTGIGFIVAFLALVKTIDYLFERAYGLTYFAILGFLIGSLFPIFPGFKGDRLHLAGLTLCLAGFVLTAWLTRKEDQIKQKES